MKLYVAAVGPSFVVTDSNACLHRTATDDYFLQSEGIAMYGITPTATLRSLETALQEKWQLPDTVTV